MGNCDSSGATRPYKFTLNDLKDLRMGDSKQMEKGCGADIAGPSAGDCQDTLKGAGFGWPENDEFEWGGMGDSCALCSGGYGCECTSGQSVGGKRGKVKRKAFKGDPNQCCLANASGKDSTKTIGDFTCDPKYRDPGGTDCINIYNNYCTVDDRMFTDSKCKGLEKNSITIFNSLMKDKCNLDTYYQNSDCLAWCSNNSTQCNKLNTFQSCKQFGISISDCTPQKVMDVQTECKQYGIRSEQGLAISACSPASIKVLTDECKEYNILESCSPTTLQDAKDNAVANAKEKRDAEYQAAQLEMNEKTQQQIQKNYETTQQTIADILDLPQAPQEPQEPQAPQAPQEPISSSFDINTIKTWIEENSTMFMIIIAIIFLIICGSSSVSVLLLKK